MSAIEIRNVKKRYKDLQALKGVSLTVEEGEFFGLLGPNGAGKTTLISILAGLARADEGSIAVRGHDVVDHFRDARRALGVVPQELVFDPFFTVRETLRIQSGYYGLRNNDAWIDEIMANLDLTDKADANMRALSGGMKRRVLVAQALVHRPPVIVLDEPTAGVDVELRQTLWQFVARLNKEGHTVLLTTHYLEEAEVLCDRVAIMDESKIVALDTPAGLIAALDADARVSYTDASGDHTVYVKDVQTTVLEVLEAARASGDAVHNLAVKGADLEDVFMQLTGREYRE
jgi:ABC-2 type transport system ATP-binding protein